MNDLETGFKEFEIEKGRFSFRLIVPYGEERRREASVRKEKGATGMRKIERK